MKLTATRLAELAPFRGASPTDLAALCELVHGWSVPRGHVLYQEGERSKGAVLVVRGRLSVFIGVGEGRRAVGDVWPGDIVGEAGLFDTEARRNATVEAAVDTELCGLEPELFVTLPHNQAVIALESQLLSHMARRIRAANNRLQQATQPTPAARPAGTPAAPPAARKGGPTSSGEARGASAGPSPAAAGAPVGARSRLLQILGLG